MSSFESGYKLTEELIKQKRPFTALACVRRHERFWRDPGADTAPACASPSNVR